MAHYEYTFILNDRINKLVEMCGRDKRRDKWKCVSFKCKHHRVMHNINVEERRRVKQKQAHISDFD